MNWGKWIVVSFVLFALFIGVLVVICVRQDISLVSRDYYREELAYQQQIDRMQNTNQLEEKPVIEVVGNALEIKFSMFASMQKGELKLFRPSDTRLDRNFVLQLSPNQKQSMDISNLPKGLYHAKMKWSMNGKEYYIEKTVTL